MANNTLKIDDSTLDSFYKKTPDFDILHFDFLNPDAVDSLKLAKAGKDATLQKLMAYQRLLRIAPNPDDAAALYENSMDSARKITSISQTQFVKQFEPKLQGGAKTAKQVYQNANVLKTQAMHLWANVNQLRKSPYYMGMTAAPAAQGVAQTFENLSSYQEIFGYLNYCDCPECKSILGPPAYLVDLLRLIDKAITAPNTTRTNSDDNIPVGLTFNERRPDISEIKLTCANTNDLVPYLQIVNEILEETLSKSLGPDIYKTLTSTFYPFNLPFNLPLTQIRTYLAQNNTSLSEIYQAMDTDTSLSVAAAREYLYISQEELANLIEQVPAQLPTVLTNNYGVTITAGNLADLNKVDTYTSQTGISLNDLHELLYQNLNPEEIFNVSGIYAPTTKGDTIAFTQNGSNVFAVYPNQGIVSGSIINNIVQGTWKDAAGSGYCEFTFSPDCSGFTGNWNTGMGLPWESTAWNGTRKTGTDPVTKKPYPTATGGIIPHNLFINKAFANKTEYLSIQLNTTDPKKVYNEIVNLDINSLDTLNRFIRLSQKLGWTYAELDWILLTLSALAAPESQDITDNTFQELAKINQLEEVYSLSRSLLSTLWYDIQTTGIGTGQFSEAPFDKIFNSPEQISSTNSSLYRPAYPSGYTRFVNPLYQTEPEQWDLNKATAADSNANIIVAGIPASMDSIRLIAMSVFVGQDSIDLTVENLSILYRHAMLAKELNIQVEEYLLLLKLLGIINKTDPNFIPSSLTPDQVLLIVKTLKWMRASGLNAFAIRYICDGTTSQYVNSGYDENNIPAFVTSLNSAIQNALLKPNNFSGYGIPQDASSAAFNWLLSNEYINDIGLVLNDKTLATGDLPNELSLPDGTTFTINSEQKTFIVSTVETFRQNQNKIFVNQLASFFGVKGDSISPVINQVQTLLDEPDYLEKFIQVPPDTTSPFIAGFIKSVSRFLLFYKSLWLNNTQINGIIKTPAAYNQIYTIDKTAFTITFQINNIYEIYAFTQLEAGFDDRKNQLVSYFADAATADYQTSLDELVAITGWNKDQLDYLLEYFFGKGKSCTTVSQLNQLNRVFTITQELGIDVYFIAQLNEMASWTSAADNWGKYKSYAASLLQKVGANSSKEAWASTFKKMNGYLEEAKRDAILNLTVLEVGKTYKDITTADNLYEFLLIDVKRGGCQDISYIKQALNSAQLYLQRCRLNLERNVVIDKADLPDVYWEWIMNYRVWEANREVFLYPENYIDPSLRDSKTDLFKTLENDLSQGNVTKDTVEAAYTKYLDSFQELATLKYVDAYHCTVENDETGDTDTLFLLARTQSKPYKYFYITRQPGDIWSQWNEINITIDSEYVTPVYAYNKLFVFWVELASHQEKELPGDQRNSIITKATIKYSFYNFSGNWAPPQILLADYVIDIEDSTRPLYGPFDGSIFNPDLLYWKKVALINLSKSNYSSDFVSVSEPEKLVVLYGPLLSQNIQTGNNPTTQGGVDFQNFVHTITDANLELVEMQNAKQDGRFPLIHSIVINTELEDSYIADQNEFLIFENNTVNVNTGNATTNFSPTFTAAMAELNRSLALYPQSNPIVNNYTEAMGLGKVSVTPPTNATPTSFINAALNIDSRISGLIYSTLQSNSVKLLDANGNVQPSITVTTAETITIVCQFSNNQQGKFVRNILFDLYFGTPYIFGEISTAPTLVIPVKNQPGWFIFQTAFESFLFEGFENSDLDKTFSKITEGTTIREPFGYVTSQSFVTDDIDQTTAGNIYSTLTSPLVQLVDANGIVSLTTLKAMTVPQLTNLLQVLSAEQGAEVYSILLNSAKVALEYNSDNFGLEDNLHTLFFKATRVTTAAVRELSRKLFTTGIDGLLSLSSQQPPENATLPFDAYQPSSQVIPPAISSGQQVAFDGPYGNYYWELFFHGPMLVAQVLNNNQQFQNAENWLQYIFNPTVKSDTVSAESFVTDDIPESLATQIYGSLESKTLGLVADGAVTPVITLITAAQLTSFLQGVDIYQGQEVYNILINNYVSDPLSRYWQFQPFRTHTRETLINQLTNPNEIHAYNTDPFDPHAIARLRIGAYEKAVVMKYIQNLIDWGDSEFRLYTWESITAALMLYVYAYDLLGPRPKDLGPCHSEFPVDFNEILKKYSNVDGGIPQFLIDMENAIAPQIQLSLQSNNGKDVPFNDIEAYFCVPENDTFISKWDTVEGRLYNIRHCLNIDGVAQPLPLFEPPIDPMSLVKAAASGNNVLDVASLTQPVIPAYRFSYMVEQAKSLTNTVIQLGNNLLSVLERNDAEGLALLQSTNELNILNLTTLVKQQQIQELQDQLEGLQQSLQSAQYRQDYYSQSLSAGLNAFEISDLALRSAAIIPQAVAIGINGVSIAGYLAPNIFGFSDGGMKFGDAINAGAAISNLEAEILNQSAGLVATAGTYQRRQEDWQFAKDTAVYDVAQITNQINANQVSIATAQQELVIHQKAIDQSQAVDTFLKSKFTNQDLYQWLISRLSSLYFQTYNLAESMALRAQAAYQFELDSSAQMIAFNYWDDLHKGLLSGESLMMSIQQMESAYIQNNTRQLEIEKTVSISRTFPEEFLKFKWGHNGGTQGTLDFTLSEKLFDFDFPGHYCRKIKSISVSIPAIVGPYQNLNATLRQNFNMVVLSSNGDGVNAVKYAIAKTVPNAGTVPPEPSSSNLRQNWVPDQAIAVSKGIDDTGMFVLDFRDERYLPFEGTGAVSTWTLSLPPSTNRINFDSISDVIINIKYTAKDGGDGFAGNVKKIYSALPDSSGDYVKAKTFDLRQAFAESWLQMFNTPPDASNQQSISFPLTDNYWLTNLSNVTVEELMLQLEVTDKDGLGGSNFLKLQVGTKNTPFNVTDNFAEINSSALQSVGFGVNSPNCTLVFDINNAPDSITKTSGSVKMLDETKLIDMAVVIVYTEKPF